jgi:plastocyanin
MLRMTTIIVQTFFRDLAKMRVMFTKPYLQLTLLIALIAASGSTPLLAQQSGLTVRMAGSVYKPANAQVHAGDTVAFMNDDSLAHTVTSSQSPASFDSKDIPAGKSWTYTFSKPGTYNYICTYHAWMKGQVTVVSGR